MHYFVKDKIEQSIKDRKKLHQRFYKNSETYKHFLELEKSAFAEGNLSK
jgi:hypothetical protein